MAAERSVEAYPASTWKPLVKPFASPDDARSWRRVGGNFAGYIAVWAGMYLSLDVHIAITVALGFVGAGFLSRIYLLSHDCGHGALFHSRTTCDRIGAICGWFDFIPHQAFAHVHSFHHASNGQLQAHHAGTGSKLISVDEWRAMSPKDRRRYKRYRSIWTTLFLRSYTNHLFFLRSFGGSRRTYSDRPQIRRSHILSDVALLVGYVALALVVGWRETLMVQGIVLAIYIPFQWFLFHSQHVFPECYNEQNRRADYTLAGLFGSLRCKWPAVLNWSTMDCQELHHIHHLAPKIPHYKLRDCMRSSPYFSEPPAVSLSECLRAARDLHLWDDQAKSLVTWPAE